MSQLDMFGAREARDEAFKKLEAHSMEWSLAARLALRKITLGWEGTAEELRLLMLRTGLPEPHHHNVWGSFVFNCIKDGLLLKTGRHGHMKTRKSHKRSTPIYRRIG